MSANQAEISQPSQGQIIPLFEQPLIIETKRVRRSAARIDYLQTSALKLSTTRSGVALKDIGKVKQEIYKLIPSEIKLLHKLLFGTIGKQTTPKLILKIEQFNGFPNTIDHNELEKKEDFLKKMQMEDLENINKALDMNPDASKNQMITNIMEFLMSPKQNSAPQKRKSASDDNEVPEKKHPPSTSRFWLSESSSDSEEENLESEVSRVVIPKKQVTFKDMVRQKTEPEVIEKQ